MIRSFKFYGFISQHRLTQLASKAQRQREPDESIHWTTVNATKISAKPIIPIRKANY